MTKQNTSSPKVLKSSHGSAWLAPWHWLQAFWQRGHLQKIIVIITSALLVLTGVLYGVARWYIAGNSHKPQIVGTTFIPAYAESLGVDPEETMDALINDLGVRHFRLVSYWNQIEPVKGSYDFSLLDWQFEKAEKVGAKVTLAMGLRQPRWPECHTPAWALHQPVSQLRPELNAYIAAVADRYKNSPSLSSYQLENEFFLDNFSEHCTDFDRQRLQDEYALLKKHDPNHPIILSRSTNTLSLSVGAPQPDTYGISVYRRVWDGQFTKRYFQYPFPAWYYAGIAGAQKLYNGRESVLHELQAEAWPPHGKFVRDVSLAEQNKSFDAERFKDVIEFGKATGMPESYLWGSEYWYYRKVILNDPSLWETSHAAFKTPPTAE